MEIYQIHWPFGMISPGYWDGLADCVEQGLVKVITLSATYNKTCFYNSNYR